MMPTGFAGLEAQLWLWLVAMIRRIMVGRPPSGCQLASSS